MSSAVAPEEQLEWEARAGRPAGAAAIVAAILMLVAFFYPQVALSGDTPTTAAQTLATLHDQPQIVIVPAVLQGIAYLLLPIPLVYLYRAVRARRQEIMPIAQYVAIGGPIATAIVLNIRQFQVINAADKFAKLNLPSHFETITGPGGLAVALERATSAEHTANDLLQNASGASVAALQYAGLLALAFAFVMISLNAMRAGLVSKFIGIIGIIVAVTTVIPVGGFSAILSVFWLGSLGVLFLNRTPGGRGPAWSVVEQIPWPTAAERRAQVLEEKGYGPEPAEAAAADEDYEDDGYEDGDGEVDGNGEPAGLDHSRSKKRKRKRRR
jgi:hypothetical protein